jgi:hypothetical protein
MKLIPGGEGGVMSVWLSIHPRLTSKPSEQNYMEFGFGLCTRNCRANLILSFGIDSE